MRRGYQPTQRCKSCRHRYRRLANPSAPCVRCGGEVVEVEARDHLRGEVNGSSKAGRERRRIVAEVTAAQSTELEAWDAAMLRLRANTDAVRPRLRGAS